MHIEICNNIPHTKKCKFLFYKKKKNQVERVKLCIFEFQKNYFAQAKENVSGLGVPPFPSFINSALHMLDKSLFHIHSFSYAQLYIATTSGRVPKNHIESVSMLMPPLDPSLPCVEQSLHCSHPYAEWKHRSKDQKIIKIANYHYYQGFFMT